LPIVNVLKSLTFGSAWGARGGGACRLLDLPHEVLLEVAHEANGAATLLALGATCRALHLSLIRSDDVWRHAFAMAFAPVIQHCFDGEVPLPPGGTLVATPPSSTRSIPSSPRSEGAAAPTKATACNESSSSSPSSSSSNSNSNRERDDDAAPGNEAVVAASGDALAEYEWDPSITTWRGWFFTFRRTFLDVARARRGRVLVLIHARLYDVTDFFEEHPGDPQLLEQSISRDASFAFDFVSHSTHAQRLMEGMAVPDLDELAREAVRLSIIHHGRRAKSHPRQHGKPDGASPSSGSSLDCSEGDDPQSPPLLWDRVLLSARRWRQWLQATMAATGPSVGGRGHAAGLLFAGSQGAASEAGKEGFLRP